MLTLTGSELAVAWLWPAVLRPHHSHAQQVPNSTAGMEGTEGTTTSLREPLVCLCPQGHPQSRLPFHKGHTRSRKCADKGEKINGLEWHPCEAQLNGQDSSVWKEKTEKEYDKTKSGREKTNRYYLLGN